MNDACLALALVLLCSFSSSSARSFLQNAVRTLHILFIQMDLEESHCSDELIASAKYDHTRTRLSARGWTQDTSHLWLVLTDIAP